LPDKELLYAFMEATGLGDDTSVGHNSMIATILAGAPDLVGMCMRLFGIIFISMTVFGLLGLRYWSAQISSKQAAAKLSEPNEDSIEDKWLPAKQDPYQSDGAAPASPTQRKPSPTQVEHLQTPLISLLTVNTDGNALRTLRVHPLKCVGGPVNGRMHLLPVNPQELTAKGCDAVWVPAFAPFEPVPELPPGKAFGVFIRSPDVRRMEIESIALYVIEQANGAYRLAFEGQVSIEDYAKMMDITEPPRQKNEKPALPVVTTISLQTGQAAVRRRVVHPVRCVGGPANGKVFPIPVDPETLFRQGTGLISVLEVSSRPPDKAFSVGRDRDSTLPYVGHMNYYVLERSQPDTYQCKFLGSADAPQYLELHGAFNEQKGR
jgi:hypothetical protein